MQDFSFIRLETTFDSAKYTRHNQIADIKFYGQVCLEPNQVYLQETNVPNGIAFDGNYAVYVVDDLDTILQDITANIAIEEFTKNGLPQIRFEILNIGKDYYGKNLHLKFVHTVSDYKWWSNAINISDKFPTTRFDYADAKDEVKKSISLKCYFDANDSESISGEYTTYEGNKVTSRLINTELEKYVFNFVDNFTFRRLNYLLSRNVIYCNGNRVTNKQTLASKDTLGSSNIYNLVFSLPINYNETYSQETQIFAPFELIGKVPFGVYTLGGLSSAIVGSFNRNISLLTGNLYLYKEGVLLHTFPYTTITTSTNEFTIDLSGIITTNGDYSIRIDGGLFESVIGEVYNGIDNDTEWTFTVTDGDFSNTDFNNEFLTN